MALQWWTTIGGYTEVTRLMKETLNGARDNWRWGRKYRRVGGGTRKLEGDMKATWDRTKLVDVKTSARRRSEVELFAGTHSIGHGIRQRRALGKDTACWTEENKVYHFGNLHTAETLFSE